MKQRHINNIANMLQRSSIENKDRSKAIHFVLAMNIAYRLPLPSGPLKSASMHFVENHRQSVLHYIDEFNEHYVVDIDVVEHLVKLFWTGRYDAVYRPESNQALTLTRSLYHSDYTENGQAKMADVLTASLTSELSYHIKNFYKKEGDE